jgi:hypothetical protein
MIRKRSVPTPEKKSVVVAGKPVRIGTRNVARPVLQLLQI